MYNDNFSNYKNLICKNLITFEENYSFDFQEFLRIF